MGHTDTTRPPVPPMGNLCWILSAISSSMFREFAGREILLSSKADWLVDPRKRMTTKNQHNWQVRYNMEEKRFCLLLVSQIPVFHLCWNQWARCVQILLGRVCEMWQLSLLNGVLFYQKDKLLNDADKLLKDKLLVAEIPWKRDSRNATYQNANTIYSSNFFPSMGKFNLSKIYWQKNKVHTLSICYFLPLGY